MDSNPEKARSACTTGTERRSVIKRKNSAPQLPSKKPRLQSKTMRTSKKNRTAPKRIKRPWNSCHERSQEKHSGKARTCRPAPNMPGLHATMASSDEKNSNAFQCTNELKPNMPETHQRSKATPSDISMFEIRRLLGKGGFGAVYEATRKSDKRVVAVKFLKRSSIPAFMKLDSGESVPEEVFYHSKVHHPAIIELLDYFWAGDYFVMVMEKPDESCDLMDYMGGSGPLEEDEAREIFKQVLEATIHCEERGIFHRDIKSENIILDVADDEVVKLTDFGLSSALQQEPYTEFRGTRDFCPPEFFSSHQYHATPTTVWQLGCLIVDCLSWLLPYKDPRDALTRPPYIPVGISTEARDLVRKMLVRDEDARPSLQEIKQHPWLGSH